MHSTGFEFEPRGRLNLLRGPRPALPVGQSCLPPSGTQPSGNRPTRSFLRLQDT